MGTKSALALLALVSLTMFPVDAQPQSTSTGGQQKTGTGIKPVSAAEFSRQFREGFLKGCLNGKTEGVKIKRVTAIAWQRLINRDTTERLWPQFLN